jgi:hypothetical protein
MLLHLQASKQEFQNPLTPVCMSVSCAVYASGKADFTQVKKVCLQRGIFASNNTNLPQVGEK